MKIEQKPGQSAHSEPPFYWLMVGIPAAIMICTVSVAIAQEPSLRTPIPILTILLMVSELVQRVLKPADTGGASSGGGDAGFLVGTESVIK